MNTPVVFCIFNRPDVTHRVFETIRQAAPSQLFVISDGPRPDRPGEGEKVEACRQIATNVDWSCDLKTNFADQNLGCRRRIQSGLDWVFEQVEEAIILEDDCLPHPSFFAYCEELLARFREDRRIATISGTNQAVIPRTSDSYIFSRYTHSWGWATWRRYWGQYDREMSGWPERGRRWIRNLEPTKHADKFWAFNFQGVHDGTIDTWDFQSIYTIWKNDWLSVIPHENLITNLGFTLDATHSNEPGHPMAEQPCGNPVFPLIHPAKIERDSVYDSELSAKLVSIYHVPLRTRLSWRLTAATPRPVWNAARNVKRFLTGWRG